MSSECPMRVVTLAILVVVIGGCSLFHQDLPNEAPLVETQADTLRVKRDGFVDLNVLASDEDDDPLLYVWVANGGTLEDNGASAEWIAPGQIEGTSQIFTVRVSVLDRQCDIVADPQDRQRCEAAAHVAVDSFLIEVVQTPPTQPSITFDETPSFQSPNITVKAAAMDEDGDLLSYEWSVGDTALTALVDSVGTEVQVIPLFTGVHVVSLTLHDRADSSTTIVILEIAPPEDVPDGGTVTLELPVEGDEPARTVGIDVFEYPNERGQVPMVVGSFFEAAQICADSGARLCTADEWALTCAGAEGAMFSSVDDPEALPARFGRRFCNTSGSDSNPSIDAAADSAWVLAESGSYPNCVSPVGAYDMTGNAQEWISQGSDSLQVGMLSAADGSCGGGEILPAVAEPPDESDVRYFQSGSGFRCCRDLAIVNGSLGSEVVDRIVGDAGQ